MSDTNELATTMREMWDEYRKLAESLEHELLNVREKMDACQTLLPDLYSRAPTASGGTGIHAAVQRHHIVNCPTQREAWKEMARVSGGVARPSDGAQLLIDAKLTDKPRRSVVSNAISWMNDSDTWERVDKGTYRLLEGSEGGETWTVECSPNDDGGGSRRTFQADGEPVVGQVLITAGR